MAESSNPIVKRRSELVVTSLLTIVLVVAVGILLWQAVEVSSLSAVQGRIDQLKPPLTGFRLLLIVLIALFWPAIIALLHRSDRIDAEGRVRLLSLRWRVVTWLAVIELILGQNLLGQFLAAVQGTVA